MYSRFIFIISLATLCLSSSISYSQTDSTHFDLGRIQLNKNLTQNITIKGADLEKMPFSNLADAVNVWLCGKYTNTGSLLYVIDGNLINNIRAYSIYDIEEVTLVQNAAAQISGAHPQQQLLLIKTKRNRKSRIEATGQTNLVNLRNTDENNKAGSYVNLYHQYYLSANENTENLKAGISATYLRDVNPSLKDSAINIHEPNNDQTFKFNGYADIKLDNNNAFSALASYAPQATNLKYTNTTIRNYQGEPFNKTVYDINDHASQNIFNTTLQLKTQIMKGFSNKISASFSHYGFMSTNLQNGTSAGAYNGTAYSRDTVTLLKDVFLLNDNLSYQKTFGDFSLEPSVNFSYRNTRDTILTGYHNDETVNAPGFPVNRGYSISHIGFRRKDYLLAPSLGLSFRNSINIQGGYLTVLNSKKSFGTYNKKIERWFPFASASINVSQLAGFNIVGVKLFGSYSKQNALLQLDNDEALMGLVPGANQNYGYSTDIIIYKAINYDPLKTSNSYKAGAVIDITNLVSLTYNFERGNFQTPVVYTISTGGGSDFSYTEIAETKLTTNRIGINFNIVHTAAARFISAINATNIKQQANLFDSDKTFGGKMWTGGWVNRFDYKNIFAGIDVLYQTGTTGTVPYSAAYYPLILNQVPRSFSLQNLYAGYLIKIDKFTNLEVFANGRNVWQNKKSTITDERRFYGLGFKLGL